MRCILIVQLSTVQFSSVQNANPFLIQLEQRQTRKTVLAGVFIFFGRCFWRCFQQIQSMQISLDNRLKNIMVSMKLICPQTLNKTVFLHTRV